ncbi:glycosyltransferase family 2 protein [Candidatus Binatia bacterium]|nr:glycosyltransferase family 2 protein [Candidatus Binatia bacterium]
MSVAVPLFNEEATIDELLARVKHTLERRGTPFEIVLVDDGSTDRTKEILARAAAEDPRVRVRTLSRNFGQAAALCCGIFESRGDVVVTLDGDLQNPPEEIPRLLEALVPGVDVVTARRGARHETAWRLAGSRVVHWIARLLVGIDIEDFGGQFKAYRREVIDATRTAWAPGKPFFALAAWLGFRVVEVPVRHDPRRSGQSRYGVLALVRLNADLITSFTTLPLAALAVLGVLCGAAGALGSLWCLVRGGAFGFAAALSLLLLGLGGVFFATAALGVYLARVYRTVAGSATGYVVRQHEP